MPRLVDNWKLAPRWLSVEALAAVAAIQVVALILSPDVKTEHLIAALSLGVSVFGIIGRVIRQNFPRLSLDHNEGESTMAPVPYPPVDGDGAVNGADIGFKNTPWENFRHIVDGNRNATESAEAINEIDRNQTWQLQIRLGLNNPDVVLQAAQFVPGHDYRRIMPKSGNPVEYPDVFVWPSVLGNRIGLTIYDVPAIIQYFNSEVEPWPVIDHAEGHVAGGP